MASETDKPATIAPLLTSKSLVEFVQTLPSEKVIESFIDGLAKSEPTALPVLVARAIPIRKALQYIEKSAEQRIASDRIILFGQQWTDPEQGVIYEFSGEPRERKVTDAAGLREALLKAGAPKDVVARAIYDVPKVNFTELNHLAKSAREWAEIITDFEGERGFAPAHLKEAK